MDSITYDLMGALIKRAKEEPLVEMIRLAELATVRQPIGFTFWIREYETMFLYDAPTTREVLHIPQDRKFPDDPITIRGAKEWLSRNMPTGNSYKESQDQERLAGRVDLEALSRLYSCFAHFRRTLDWLYTQQSPAIYPFRFS